MATGLEYREKATVSIVAAIVFIDMLGVGLTLPVMPGLLGELTGAGLTEAAAYGGLLLLSYAAMQFLFAPVVGNLSDRFGRKPVLLITLFALAIDYLVMAFAPSLIWLVIGRILSGIMGASWVAANSCIADVMPVERRGSGFGWIAGAGAAGIVLGPITGGLAGELGVRVPFLLAAGLAALGTVIGWLHLHETLPLDARRPFHLANINPLAVLFRVARNRVISTCLVAIFMVQLSTQAHMSIWAFWGAQQFGWTPVLSGLTASLFAVILGTVQAVFTGPSITRFGALPTAVGALVFGIPSYLLLAFAPSMGFVLLAILLGGLTGVAFPALQTLMTAQTDKSAQGELQGAIGSTHSLPAMVGPIIMTQVFAHSADDKGIYFPGAAFVLAACLLIIAIALLLSRKREIERSVGVDSFTAG